MINKALLSPANIIAIGAMLVFLIVLLWGAGNLTSTGQPS